MAFLIVYLTWNKTVTVAIELDIMDFGWYWPCEVNILEQTQNFISCQ